MKEPNNEISIYAADDMVAIGVPNGVCYVAPRAAIEMTVSLMRAALKADPLLDIDAISDAYLCRKETVQ